MAYEQRPNQTNCFAKEGFEGFSGKITINEPGEYWISVYDNEGQRGPYKGVKLKKAQPAKAGPDNAQRAANREQTHYDGKRNGYQDDNSTLGRNSWGEEVPF